MLEDWVCVPEHVIFLKVRVLKRISGEADLVPGQVFLALPLGLAFMVASEREEREPQAEADLAKVP